MSRIRVDVPRNYTGLITVVRETQFLRRGVDIIFSALTKKKKFQAVNAYLKQQAVLDIRKTSNNQKIESVTFKGQGEKATAKNTTDGLEYWSFGPWGYPTTVCITVAHEDKGNWVGSDMAGPYTVSFIKL